MNGYSFRDILRHAANDGAWPAFWRHAEPKAKYDAVIVGGGGHGLAAAYYLAKEFNLRNVAVLEKSWLGGGNTGRNTAIVRSTYFNDESIRLYETGRRMFETLSQELGVNIMFSKRGTLGLLHNTHQVNMARRLCNAICVNGASAALIGPEEVARRVPGLNFSATARYPIVGAIVQDNAGIARHDAVAWGFARGADRFGVDIIQNCEVTGFGIRDGAVSGVRTTKGNITAPRVGLAAAAATPKLAAMAGFRLPIMPQTLQAMVSEPVKPFLHTVLDSDAAHVYVSQSDRGELVIGGSADGYPSSMQKGAFRTVQANIEALCEIFPRIGNLKLMRRWAGVIDITPDSSPILGLSPVKGMFLDCGWGPGGFKATAIAGRLLAEAMARGEPPELAAPFSLNRFRENALVDEAIGAGVAH